jgi:hypothetical protein
MSEWYYARDNVPCGPVAKAEIQRMAAFGDLTPSDLVWREGMAEWTRAGTAKELFPEGLPYAADAPGPRRRLERSTGAESGPARREFYPIRRGLSTGAKIGLILGVVGGVTAAGVIIIVLVLAFGGASGSGSYTVRISRGDIKREFLEFPGNSDVEIVVKSDVTDPFTDVDLVVFDDSNGQQVASDLSPSKDCLVRFHVPVTQRYQIELENLGPGDARCVVTYKSIPRRR